MFNGQVSLRKDGLREVSVMNPKSGEIVSVSISVLFNMSTLEYTHL